MKFLRYFFLALFLLGSFSYAQEAQVSDIQRRIEERIKEKERLQREANRLQRQLEEVGSQRAGISSELQRIAQERQSLENEIAQTQNEITTLELQTKRSESLIRTYSQKINDNTSVLESLIRAYHTTTPASEFELFLSSESISDLVAKRDNFLRLQEPIIKTTYDLRNNRDLAYESTRELRLQQEDLSEEQEILDDQKEIVASQEREKDQVLKQVQQQERSVEQSLQSTLATIAQLDQEVRSFESTIEFLLDKSSIPDTGSAVLAWPLDYVLITQRFGKTVSSERLYVSGSHSGMDFRASVGTPVYATADGVVRGVGDTDQTCPRASFGKWIFIEHDGIGLSSTSAHLSKFAVSEGQRVKQGELIGYSGNTGRSTAPHLHLTIYATQGVDGGEGARITERPSAACSGSTYRMPLAPTRAYLDPINYLPATNASMFKHPSLAN